MNAKTCCVTGCDRYAGWLTWDDDLGEIEVCADHAGYDDWEGLQAEAEAQRLPQEVIDVVGVSRRDVLAHPTIEQSTVDGHLHETFAFTAIGWHYEHGTRLPAAEGDTRLTRFDLERIDHGPARPRR